MRYSTAQFSRTGDTFVTEMSSFSKGFEEDWGRLAFYLTSTRTGTTVRMVTDHVRRDREGEPTAWVFRPASLPAGARPFRVVAFND